ncbi:hypothetical protein [Pseudomonas aeruginosa]
MCRRVNRAAALYCRSKKHFITGVALMVTATGVAHAANTVDSRFTNTIVTGDGNSVTGNRDTHFSGATSANDQVIVGNHNTLNNTMSSEIIGNYNTVTNSDIAVKGESNTVSNAYGQLVGDSNKIDAANGTTTVIGSSNNVTGQSNTAVGNGHTMTGRGSVAIGEATTTTASNSVTLGTGSSNNRDNTVSVGAAGAERQITNVAGGSARTDASNLGQVQDGDAATLAAAKGYTDTQVSAEAQKRADEDNRVLSTATNHTNQAVANEAQTRGQEDARVLGEAIDHANVVRRRERMVTMKKLLVTLTLAGAVGLSSGAQAMSACEVALCMYGKTTGNSGGSECRAAEKKFFSIQVRKKGKFKPNPTFEKRKQYLNGCSEADPDAAARALGADPAAKSKILNKYGRVPG